jgi:hypothetical protein
MACPYASASNGGYPIQIDTQVQQPNRLLPQVGVLKTPLLVKGN